MQRLSRLAPVLSITALALSNIAFALPPNSPAPDFKGTDSNGVQHALSEYRGKYVVLEWANQGCPYEQKHYLSGNMEGLQKQWTSRGIVWLSIISSAPGQQGYVSPAQENDYLHKMNAAPTAVLLDPAGAIGHMYDARTTPHIFVIDPAGKIIYQGAIDNKPTPDQADLKTADNYLNDALNAALAGKPVSVAITKPYGCSVKY
jgi:hypothetical protein